MKRVTRFAAMAVILIVVSTVSAKADGTLTYTLTAEGSSTPLATWVMPLNPNPTTCGFPPCFDDGNYFAFATGVSIDGGAPVSDLLVFMNTTSFPQDLNDTNSLIPEFTGPQLYSGAESDPTMIVPASGFFTLVDDGTNPNFVGGTVYTLDVVQKTPEPSTLLLFGSGLFALAMRKRRAAH
jgi:PEP-CTERM motif